MTRSRRLVPVPAGTALLLALLVIAPLAAQERKFPRVYVEPVDEGVGFNDEPSMALAADGTLYVAWVSFREGHDTLQVARYRPHGESFRRLGGWEILGGPRTYVLRPQVAAAGDGVFVVYAAEFGRNWDIYAVRVDADGPGKPVRATRHPAVDTDPAAVWSGGTLWIAWETNREGARRILLAGVRDGEAGEAEQVSQQGRSNYDPAVAVRPNGAVAVAWHRFSDGNYDVWLRERRPGAGWAPERRLTHAPSIDRHARLLVHGPDLWLIYENAQTEGYWIGRTNRRRTIVARVTPNGLETLPDYRENEHLWSRSEAAAAAFDSLGRLWIAYLKPRLPRAGWDHYLACFNGKEWLGPGRITRRKGMDRRPSVAIAGDRLYVAIQADDLAETWTQDDPALTTQARSRILIGRADLRRAPSEAAAIQTVPLAEPEEPFEAGRLRSAYGEDLQTPVIQYRGKELKLYYGDLHAHSDVSVCNRCGDQSIDENYQHRRDIARLDFAAMTDHGYNIVPYLWNYTAKLARVNEDPGRLMTFLAEEWTSSFERYTKENPWGYYGHRNLILEDPYFPVWWNAFTGETPAELWRELRRMGASFVQIPHQLADTGNVPTDWRFVDEEAQPVAEIFQTRGSYEYHGAPRQARRSIQASGRYLRDVWDSGTVIGVIASPDHGGGVGKACVWAEELSRKAILEAIRKRHTFGTTAARVVLEVRVNGHLMGEKIAGPPPEKVEVKIRARCPAPIRRIEVCRNGKFVYASEPGAREADLVFLDTAPEAGRSYYYVRLIQTDEEIAWSSPVWLAAE